MDHGFGIFAFGGTACAKEVLVLDNPEFLAVIEPQLFTRFDVRRGEKTNSRKSEILMIYEHLKKKRAVQVSIPNASLLLINFKVQTSSWPKYPTLFFFHRSSQISNQAPNDGSCHMDEKGVYTHSSLQDYPSVSQINHKVRNKIVGLQFSAYFFAQ